MFFSLKLTVIYYIINIITKISAKVIQTKNRNIASKMSFKIEIEEKFKRSKNNKKYVYPRNG